MKDKDNSKLLGTMLLCTGVLGIIISLALLSLTWVAKVRIHKTITVSLTAINDAFTTTKEGIQVIDGALSQAEQNIDTLEVSFTSLTDSLEDIKQISTDASLMFDDQLVGIVNSAQTSLDSSASSARLIDSALNALASLPFLGLDFRPEIPLHTSLGDLSSNLNSLPENLQQISGYLASFSENLTELALSSSSINTQLDTLGSQVDEARLVLNDYQDIIDDMIEWIEKTKINLNIWLTVFAIFISLFCLWLLLSQLLPLSEAKKYLVGKDHYIDLASSHNENKTI